MQIKELIKHLETAYPLKYQESYDNSGLLVDRLNQEVNSALLTLDITPEVIDEAISKKADMVISHHPVIFKPLKKILNSTPTEKIIRKALAHDIAIYSAHTNMDSAQGGTNDKVCELLKLKNCKVLSTMENFLFKVVVFVPHDHTEKVRSALFEAGGGAIGEYDSCSYNTSGQGTFRAGDNTNPFVGKKGELHFEDEIKIETIVPKHLLSKAISNMINAHPYEEVAYDIFAMENKYEAAGLGRVGELPEAMPKEKFLTYVKDALQADHLRYAGEAETIKKVALCTGSGSSLASLAASKNADVYISADFKYHEFQAAAEHLMVIDAGHYHTEKFAKDIFYNLINEKFPKFALYLSELNTNPINIH
ncbi:MAG: Nif3-like dinuclear metal center hexameric protein [Salinivirgaceae bacterium]